MFVCNQIIYWSLSILSSLSSSGSLVSIRNLLHSSGRFALLTLQHRQSGLIFSFNHSIETLAILALYVLSNICHKDFEEILLSVGTNEGHLIGSTDVTFATKLRHEVIEHVLWISVDGNCLLTEVTPCGLGSVPRALRFDELELARLITAIWLLDNFNDSLEQEVIGEGFMSINFVKI